MHKICFRPPPEQKEKTIYVRKKLLKFLVHIFVKIPLTVGSTKWLYSLLFPLITLSSPVSKCWDSIAVLKVE